jgi:hypothetical protein
VEQPHQGFGAVKKHARKKHVTKFDPLDPIIVSAVRIVDPPSRLRDAFRQAVMDARYSLVDAQEQRSKIGQLKKKKDAAETLASALARVDTAMKNTDLSPELAVNPFTLLKLTDLAERCREFIDTPAEGRMQEPANDKRDAVHHAHHLLEGYGSSEAKSQLGKYCELAALLANTTTAKIRSVCKAHPGIKAKTTGEN